VLDRGEVLPVRLYKWLPTMADCSESDRQRGMVINL